jgi:hypothetical protein
MALRPPRAHLALLPWAFGSKLSFLDSSPQFRSMTLGGLDESAPLVADGHNGRR